MSDDHDLVPLNTVQPGVVKLDTIECPDKEKTRRLMEMGICNGCSIEVCKSCYNMVLCKIRGYCLALRQEDAKYIKVYKEGSD